MSARTAGWWIVAGVVAIVLLTVEAVAAVTAGMWPLAVLAAVLAAVWVPTLRELHEARMSDVSSRPPGSASADPDRGPRQTPGRGHPSPQPPPRSHNPCHAQTSICRFSPTTR